MATARKSSKPVSQAKARHVARGKAEKPLANTSLPPGFRTVSSSYAPTWQPWNDEEQPTELVGTWGAVRTVETKRGRGTQEQQVCSIDTEDHGSFTVWCSAALVPFFEEAKEGDTVFLRFDGMGPARGRKQPMKLITAAIEE